MGFLFSNAVHCEFISMLQSPSTVRYSQVPASQSGRCLISTFSTSIVFNRTNTEAQSDNARSDSDALIISCEAPLMPAASPVHVVSLSSHIDQLEKGISVCRADNLQQSLRQENRLTSVGKLACTAHQRLCECRGVPCMDLCFSFASAVPWGGWSSRRKCCTNSR